MSYGSGPGKKKGVLIQQHDVELDAQQYPVHLRDIVGNPAFAQGYRLPLVFPQERGFKSLADAIMYIKKMPPEDAAMFAAGYTAKMFQAHGSLIGNMMLKRFKDEGLYEGSDQERIKKVLGHACGSHIKRLGRVKWPSNWEKL